jgi:hypothetical protein
MRPTYTKPSAPRSKSLDGSAGQSATGRACSDRGAGACRRLWSRCAHGCRANEHPPGPKNTLFSDDYTMPEGDEYTIREA